MVAEHRLSIIILNYNTPELTCRCLETIETAITSQDEWEVFIVDNGSTDQSLEYIHDWVKKSRLKQLIKVLPAKKNLGFAAGNNLAIREATGDTILLLNSDTEVGDSAIQSSLTQLWEKTDRGALSCAVFLTDGQLDPACHRGFPTPWAALTYFTKLEQLFPKVPLFSGYHQWYKDLQRPHDVDAISGAFFMVKRSVLERTGLLDEAFFMYGEDLDLAFRIRKQGYTIHYFPTVSILHKKKQSGRKSNNKQLQGLTERSFYQTMIQFYRKHYVSQYPGWLNWLIISVLRLKITAIR